MSQSPKRDSPPDQVASSSVTITQTETTNNADRADSSSPRLRVTLTRPDVDKRVEWSSDTVDNEHMGKKKSKCCCIYEKPRRFDESSSESDSEGECDHCSGHVEKKKKNRKHPPCGKNSANQNAETPQGPLKHQ